MTTNAEKIAQWRVANPGVRVTAGVLRDLWGADLRGANLQGANLQGADLRGANLRGAIGVLSIPAGIPSGPVLCYPLTDGWFMRVGCWWGTPGELRTLIAQDDDWPEAEGDEITRRRPYLEAVLGLVDVYTADRAADLVAVRERWGSQNGGKDTAGGTG